MRAAINSLFVVILVSGTVLFAQKSDIFTKGQNQTSTTKTPSIEDYLFNQPEPDYKIISSNSSYIEIEYYPQQPSINNIDYQGERLSVYNFKYALANDVDKAGSPDIRFRNFSVITPSETNNKVQVIDYDVSEQHSVRIAPVPQMNFKNPFTRDFAGLYYTYNKNSEYSQNKFMPADIASFVNRGSLRELSIGNLIIHPYQYNPVSGTLKVYSRIRVRINFGDQPVMLNRPRTREEISLLSGIALNSDIAMNWLNPKVKGVFDNTRALSSALAAGDWYKIEVKDNDNSTSEGMYKLTKSFLEGGGINFTNVDPRRIKIFGNGGNLLPEGLTDPRPEDLVELAVYVEGENDGSFDSQDYILFYGRATNNWNYDSTLNEFQHYINYYSRSNYYWICINTPNNGRRMQIQPSENSGSPNTPTSFTERIFYEPEQSNLINEGNLWLSIRKSSGGSFEWSTTLTGLQGGTDILYKIKVASRCMEGNTNYSLIKDDYSNLSELNLPMGNTAPGFGNWIWTNLTPFTFTVNQSQKTNGEQVKFRQTYFASNGESEGYLDWMEIQYKRRLNSAQDDRLRFDSPDYNGVVEYNVSSFSGNNIKVFDATVHDNVKIIQPLNVSSSNVRFQKTEVQSILSRYFVIGPGPNAYKTPTSISSRIPNQNLRGITEGASFVIITHADFLTAADRLKNKRESVGSSNPDYLKTMVVTTEQIYNEFSGGVLDAVAIRDFLKHAYAEWNIKPSYVCFFGDGSFDYKDILGYDRNFVPAFEKTDPYINQVAGFTTDDFYANVIGNNFPSDPPDFAHGRIPASSVQEVNDYLDKVDAYENGANNGYWKNKMLFVADDQKTSEGCEFTQHLAQCESLAEFHDPQYIDKIKVYLVNYPTVITPQGRRKPQVNADIAKYWTDGVLNIHYTGHGSPDVWAHEYVLEKDNIISQVNNINKYPFVSIASCDMSKFDNPASKSAGELFMLAPRKGAIGTLAATRPVYAESNAIFMYSFFDNLYIPRDTLLLQKRFGAALFQTKQIPNISENDLKYILMCDPTVRVQMPRFRSHIDSISGLSGDTMRALSKIKIYGSILRPDSSNWSNYNGSIVLKIYDVDRQVSILDECGITHNFRQNGGAIYSGIQKIINGKWVVEYIVPRDISYLNSNGRLINYFYNTQADGAGVNRDFIVGGIDPNAPSDSIGPKISLFIDTRNFRSGDLVNENFKFIADLFDESGINTTGTIGHKLEAVLDGNENAKYDLTNFYTSDSSYKSGTIEFDFSGIALGRHSLRFKAWDTYNNSSEATIDFNVSSSTALQVTNVYNYPNPFKDNTAFTFQHNYPTDINVRIKIYTVAGRLIKEIQQNNISDKFVVVNWSGKDEDGETLGNGIYIYKLVVETAEGSSVTNTGKLAVLK